MQILLWGINETITYKHNIFGGGITALKFCYENHQLSADCRWKSEPLATSDHYHGQGGLDNPINSLTSLHGF